MCPLLYLFLKTMNNIDFFMYSEYKVDKKCIMVSRTHKKIQEKYCVKMYIEI